MKQFDISDINKIDIVAGEFIKEYSDARIIAFNGPMGIGKTTFIKAICKALNVKDTVNSPSFAIVNEYETNKDVKVYHFDFYRLKEMDEAYDMGYEDYLYSGAYCFIEWPDKIAPLLPEERLDLTFEEKGDQSRIITVTEIKNT